MHSAEQQFVHLPRLGGPWSVSQPFHVLSSIHNVDISSSSFILGTGSRGTTNRSFGDVSSRKVVLGRLFTLFLDVLGSLPRHARTHVFCRDATDERLWRTGWLIIATRSSF